MERWRESAEGVPLKVQYQQVAARKAGEDGRICYNHGIRPRPEDIMNVDVRYVSIPLLSLAMSAVMFSSGEIVSKALTFTTNIRQP